MHHKPKDKLSSQTREGHWIGFDVDSHAHRIYWPSTCTVTVEHDIYLGSTALLEGEPMAIPTVQSERTVSCVATPLLVSPPGSPLTQLDSPISETPEESMPFDNPLPAPAPSQIDLPAPEEAPPQLQRSTRNKKPSRVVCDLQEGVGVNVADKAGGAWHVEDGSPSLLEDFDGLEHVFVATTSDAEALEPRSLAEAKCRPDWHLWEKAI
jgi:hypothetical protein